MDRGSGSGSRFFPDPDPGDPKRPDSDLQYWLKPWIRIQYINVGNRIPLGAVKSTENHQEIHPFSLIFTFNRLTLSRNATLLNKLEINNYIFAEFTSELFFKIEMICKLIKILLEPGPDPTLHDFNISSSIITAKYP